MLERKLDRGFESQTKAMERPSTIQDRSERGATPPCGEEALFRSESSPRLFGEGNYAEGGSNEEGNYEVRDANPHGSSGGFSDAGGFGATQLLGDRALLLDSPGSTPQGPGEKPRKEDERPGS